MRISRVHFHRLLAHVLILANRATQAAVLPRHHVPEEPAKRDTADTTCSLIVDISIGGDGSSQKTLVVPPCLAGVPLQVGVNIDLSDQGAGAQSSSATSASTATTTSTAPPTTDPASTTTSAPSSSTSGTSDPGDDCDDDPDDGDDSGSECSDDDDDCTCDDDGDGDPSSSSANPGSSHTATSTSPHPSSSSGPSSNTTDNDGQWYTDKCPRAATWYTQDDNAGACGKKYSDADHIVALSWKIFGGNGYDGPSCGKTIHIKTSAGKTGDAVVADECASCPDEYHVDMSTGLFQDLGLDEDTGEYQVQWSCPDCKFEEDPTIGGCKDDPNGQYC